MKVEIRKAKIQFMKLKIHLKLKFVNRNPPYLVNFIDKFRYRYPIFNCTDEQKYLVTYTQFVSHVCRTTTTPHPHDKRWSGSGECE